MNDLTKIDALIEAVAAGSIPDDGNNGHFRALGFYHMTRAWMTYRGSLDAAKALQEALLPGWRVGSISQAYASPQDTPDLWRVWLVAPDYLESCVQSEAENPWVARAWLLAILRAFRAKLESSQ